MLLQWNATDNLPMWGSGGALKVSSKRSGSNIVVYQAVDAVAGHTYKCDVAYRGTATNKDFWMQCFVLENEPVHYADLYMAEDQTIGQLNSWADSSVGNFDGNMSTKAKAGKNHTDGVMTWKAPKSGRYYFALKMGTQAHPFTATLDNFVMRSLTSSAIDAVEAEAAELYTLAGRTLSVADGARVFDINGREMQPGDMAPGIYIVTSASRSCKVAIR